MQHSFSHVPVNDYKAWSTSAIPLEDQAHRVMRAMRAKNDAVYCRANSSHTMVVMENGCQSRRNSYGHDY